MMQICIILWISIYHWSKVRFTAKQLEIARNVLCRNYFCFWNQGWLIQTKTCEDACALKFFKIFLAITRYKREYLCWRKRLKRWFRSFFSSFLVEKRNIVGIYCKLTCLCARAVLSSAFQCCWNKRGKMCWISNILTWDTERVVKRPENNCSPFVIVLISLLMYEFLWEPNIKAQSWKCIWCQE